MTKKKANLTPEQEEAIAQAELLKKQIEAATRLLKLKRAHDSLIEFAKMVMPDPQRPDDPEATRYEVQPHHILIADALQKVERGEILRLAISLPPRHGKSELATRLFPSWFMGRDPYRQCILAGYSAEFAEAEFGGKVKRFIQSPQYQQIFPLASLSGGSRAVSNIVFREGGNIASVGKGGAITGRGADLLVIDDPIQNTEEAMSALQRQKLWDWFTGTAMTRLMKGGRAVVIHTRWHQDDLIGRLCDPSHPDYNPQIGKQWTHINVPAVIKEPHLAEALGLPLAAPDDEFVTSTFGREPMTALWPERYGLRFLSEIKKLSPRDFSAQYQGNPTPDDGDFFKAEYLKTYRPEQLPRNLQYYTASDHAVSESQQADSTVLLTVGVDEQDNIWIVDCWWRKANAEVVVDAMVDVMARWKPLLWWAERGHISKSIGPFLRKRQMERKAYAAVVEVTPVKDKMTRAQAIQGRMSMGKVYFPEFAPWWNDAREELLKFPAARHDDFVDALAHVGMGLAAQVRASNPIRTVDAVPKSGTIAWIKWASDWEKRRRETGNRGGF